MLSNYSDRLRLSFFEKLDKIYLKTDKSHIRRTNNLRLIPNFKYRRGGKLSYAEWAHVIGIFQSILYQNLTEKSGNHILDIGCGTGLFGIAAEPYTLNGGSYTGIDINKEDLDFCSENYSMDNYTFIHMNVMNPAYTKNQRERKKSWPVNNESFDLVSAISVWTHLNEEDAIYYLQEVERVLKKNSKAIITFFYLDKEYWNSIDERSAMNSRYHATRQDKWIFNKKAYNSDNWLTTSWATHPEDAVGVTNSGLKTLLNTSNLYLDTYYPGNWKEKPGIFFQDILILGKQDES